MSEIPLILVTNDDGVNAKGLKALIEVVKKFGKVVVVAPATPQSGMSHAITVRNPLRIECIDKKEDVEIYCCNGTPVDCVKLAFSKVLSKKPNLLVSGINHGSNASTSIFYSGTMGAALEGCINYVPSVGFSLLSTHPDADFTASKVYSEKIVKKVLEDGLDDHVCLNVNIPDVPLNDIKGIRVVRQTKGYWKEEFDPRIDPDGHEYFWLKGKFHNIEPDAIDTDEWALKNNYVSIVPINIDLTCYDTLKKIKHWEQN